MANRRGYKRKFQTSIQSDANNLEIYKDLTTRFKPLDDLALVVNMEQTQDLEIIHKGIPFSCLMREIDLERRWYMIMYRDEISDVAMDRIRGIHPELKAMVKKHALYSRQEEAVLSQIKSTATPSLSDFENLLKENSAVFYESRTPRRLRQYWMKLRRFKLLDDQEVLADDSLTFEDLEKAIDEHYQYAGDDTELRREQQMNDRERHFQITKLQYEIQSLNYLIHMLSKKKPEMGRNVLAVLHGDNYVFFMHTKYVTFGRSTGNNEDSEFPIWGAENRISRIQGSIELKRNFKFILTNKGRAAIFVNGYPILTNETVQLGHNCMIEVCDVKLRFQIVCDYNGETAEGTVN